MRDRFDDNAILVGVWCGDAPAWALHRTVKTRAPTLSKLLLRTGENYSNRTVLGNIMNQMNIIKAEFAKVLQVFEASPAMQRILRGNMTIEHYKSYLQQTYHYTKDNPQIQALATVYFRGNDREYVRMFYKHAISEIGHDELALSDLKTLGENIDQVRIENPLPATVALNAFVYYQIYNRNPIGYLGYLFFLEFLPTGSGAAYMQLLEKAGVPKSAMGFLLEHTNVDVYHNRLMEKYIEGLVKTEADLQAIIYSMRGTGELYASMLHAAFMQAEKPVAWGIDSQEAARYNADNHGKSDELDSDELVIQAQAA